MSFYIHKSLEKYICKTLTANVSCKIKYELAHYITKNGDYSLFPRSHKISTIKIFSLTIL